MKTQNVTVALDADLVREAKHLAVDEGVSLSRLVAQALEQRVRGSREFRAASERQRRLLKEGLPLGTYGQVTWDRESLHER